MFWTKHTKDLFFLATMRYVLEDVPERIGNLAREMVGWWLGERPDLLF